MPILILPSPADMAHYGPSLDMQKYDLLQGFWFLGDNFIIILIYIELNIDLIVEKSKKN